MAGEIYRFGRQYLGGITLPAGGNTGQVLMKNSNNTADYGWHDAPALPQGGLTGQSLIKHSDTDGDFEWADIGGAIFSYVVGETPYASDWLSLTEDGDPLTPSAGLIYLIISEGAYYHQFVRYAAENEEYLVISSGSTSGGGAVFSYIVGTTALAPDWLSETPAGSPLTPNDHSLYLILTDGDYKNAFYRFDSTSNLYVEVTKSDLAAIATPFDATHSYVVGDYCSKDGQIWRFTSTHTGAWNASHVMACTTMGEVQALHSALDTLGGTVSDIDTVVDGLSDSLDTLSGTVDDLSDGVDALAETIPEVMSAADVQDLLDAIEASIPVSPTYPGSVICFSVGELSIESGGYSFVTLFTNDPSGEFTVTSSDTNIVTGSVVSDPFGIKLMVEAEVVLEDSTATIRVVSGEAVANLSVTVLVAGV